VHVSRVKLRNFRNYERVEIELGSGLTIVHGPVGAGKTNLLEAVYFGCVGRSCRGAADRELVRFGERIAFVCVTASNANEPHSFEVALERGGPKVTRVDGARSERIAELAERPLLCVFMPDRLELVKGPAGLRRAHLDALVSALWPSRRATRAAYGRALAQRNALLSRVRAGRSSPDALAGWNRELARHGVELVRDRAAAAQAIVGGVQARGADLGLGELSLHYRPRIEAREQKQFEHELESALDQDLARGFTTRGPHRDDLLLERAGRELRRYGSQGQQRLGLLALILAERDALAAARGRTPVLLLDDVLSELDSEHRELLLELVGREGQTLVTTADLPAASSSPGAVSLRVAAGAVHER
jgi:DNA replication and repair protein RecF